MSALDGADAWAAGVPTWSIALALVENGVTTAAAVYVPAADDLYVAQGGVLRWNGELVPAGGLEPARTGFVLALADLARRSPLRLRRRHPLGSPAYHLALVARGGADGALLDRPRLCDVAPGLALLAATGGEAIDLRERTPVGLGAWLDSRPPRRLLVARARCVRRDPAAHATRLSAPRRSPGERHLAMRRPAGRPGAWK